MITTKNYKGENWKQINCDNCNEILTNNDGQNLMPDDLAIENMAMEEDWIRGQGGENIHLCPNCPDEYLEQLTVND